MCWGGGVLETAGPVASATLTAAVSTGVGVGGLSSGVSTSSSG